MVQILLCPDEDLTHFVNSAGEPAYLRVDEKLKHLSYLFTHFLIVTKNVLAAKLGMFLDHEEVLGGNVIEATTIFIEAWFPKQAAQISDAERCVQLNNLLPWTHGVYAREERTGFGFPSGGSYNGDCWKIIHCKVPITFLGEGPAIMMV